MHLKVPAAHDVAHKTVVVRVDYNVPLATENGNITIVDDRRIQASLPTISFLLQHNAKVVLISHVGRPTGRDPKLSFAPIAQYLKTNLELPVTFIGQTIGAEVKANIAAHPPKSIVLLENVRFHGEEEQNDRSFAQQLAELGEVYINDAFSAAHRAHASTEGITKFLPSFAGLSLVKEVEALDRLLANPPRPFVCVVGGAKISDKVQTLVHLIEVADTILVGGGIANIFLKAKGLEVHHSYVEPKTVDIAKQLFASNNNKIVFPTDVIAAANVDSTDTQVVDTNVIDTPNDKDLMFLDIGPQTRAHYSLLLAGAKTIFWNGPMGVFEKPSFAEGTTAIASAMANNQGLTVVGGGDTVAAVEQLNLQDKMSYISLAGGAALDFLAGKVLPGLVPLQVSDISNMYI